MVASLSVETCFILVLAVCSAPEHSITSGVVHMHISGPTIEQQITLCGIRKPGSVKYFPVDTCWLVDQYYRSLAKERPPSKECLLHTFGSTSC